MNDDAELLHRYTAENSESAFGDLIRRYADLVYSAALRLLGGDVHRAQDVTQQVFSELARHAGRLAAHPTLAGWLYTTTRLMARRAMRTEQRRKAREHEANVMNELLRGTAPDTDWEQLRPVLEDAMHDLGEKDRLAVLLRFFQNKSLREVGSVLGLNENAARMRVERALDKLRARLARKGVTSSAAALASLLAANAVAAAPQAFVATLTSASIAGAAATTGTTLTILELMALNKIKTGIVGALLVAGAASPMVLQHQSQLKLREENGALRQQAEHVGQLTAENQRLSNLTVRTRSSLTADELSELLRLRGEIGLLRKQTNELEKLREENRHLRAALTKAGQKPQEREWNAAFEHQMQRGRVAKMVALPLILYASDHQDQLPANWDQAAPYFASALKSDPIFLDADEYFRAANQFEIVLQGSRDVLKGLSNPGSIILIRERQAWRTLDGKWAKAYGFADGHGEFHVEADGNFDAWEKQRMIPSAGGQATQ
ncbi:MAG: sigma-70 family RNA polymerase sigma factor [Verrucomicrobia bacterium]|nr:sigma-70 family RNA polymerase sigma factor [Verrucomicrobiota bacterium]